MDSFTQFLVTLYWDGNVTQCNGNIHCDSHTKRSSIVIRRRMSYAEFLDLSYNYVGVTRSACRLALTLLYQFEGADYSSLILGDESLDMLYYLASMNEGYCGHVVISKESVCDVQYPSMTQLLQNFTVFNDAGRWSQPWHQSSVTENLQQSIYEVDAAGPSTHEREMYNTTADHPVVVRNDDERAATVSGFEAQSDEECSSEHSDQNEDSSPPVSTDNDDSDEDEQAFLPPMLDDGNMHVGVMDEVDEELPEWADEDEVDMWSPNDGDIRLGMYFKGKSELDKAIRLWNVKNSREIIITDSNKTIYKAKCYSTHTEYQPLAGEAKCNWLVRASNRNSLHKWRIYKWVPRHNCYGRMVRNNNRSLKSKTIAEYVRHLVEANVACKVCVIVAEIKNKLNVTVSYQKAWHGRKKAIEGLYGSWESNFQQLPSYISALQRANPNTVVQWSHNQNSCTSSATFKYVFWAFGPSIEAFHHCHPVICIDGTHLKGSYKGKMLTAVTKNANNHVLPVAYAIVDEETNESWGWFLQMLRLYVANRSQESLCVVSDRHHGIIYAMENLPTWQEPHAYHRYCLRHVRSNVLSRFKIPRLRRLVWELGSTTQLRKFRATRADIRRVSAEAWQYLEDIGVSKWTLLHDDHHRRWGNLTTNVAESMNNALKVARLLPIKACIEHTFVKTVEHFRKQYEIAVHCSTPLPPRMWRVFTIREAQAQQHQVTEFDLRQQIYRVVSRQSTNDRGGNDFTVKYKKHRCTCGKWQMTRFPCSHAIAVCRHRGDEISKVVHPVYTTSTYRNQYATGFMPVEHEDYWDDPGWTIHGDPRRVTTARGRRRARRIRNEMDVLYPDQRIRRCTICKQPGHNSTTCPNSQPSTY